MTACSRRFLVSFPALLALAFLLPLPRCAIARERASTDVVDAFAHVNVLPMDSERVLKDQTVLVANGTITAIGPSLRIPADARVIDGHGSAFLSPGLADMHTHSDNARDMKVYLANGVTSVLNMGEASNGFITQVRPAINAGTRPGPHIYAAFVVDGSPEFGHFFVTTPEEARWIVRLAKTNGYQFIKVYNNLSPECFNALVDEGRRQHLSVVGHGVTRVGIERQLDAGQLMVAHAEEFLYTVFAKPGDEQTDHAPALDRIPAAIAMVRRNHAFVTADLNTYATIARQWGKPDVVEGFMRRPDIRYVSPRWRMQWKGGDYTGRHGDLSAKLQFLARFIKAMSDAGVPLITGTDAPTIAGLVPGVSLQDDLHALEDAGLTRYQVLSAATRVPGDLIHRAIPDATPFGVVKVGHRADLILSRTNPFDDLETLRAPLGVMANGRWYAASDLQAMLDGVAKDYEESTHAPPGDAHRS
jgi:hypothetical protein